MKLLILILFSTILLTSSLDSIENSILPLVESYKNLGNLPIHKYSTKQFQQIQNALLRKNESLRLASYNILSDEMDGRYGKRAFWKARLPLIIDLIKDMQPDILAMQELSESQLNDMLPLMQDTYEFYGHPRYKDKEFNGFFYRKERFKVELHALFTIYDSGSITNTITMLELNDKITHKRFAAFNTHLPYTNPNQRELEIRSILKLIKPILKKLPAIFVGDLNTFPNRLDLNLPFYDGDYIHRLLTEEVFEDASEIALLGHFGPIASYTNRPDNVAPFCGQGVPGIILDRIYVSDKVQVLVHAIEPATVNKFYPSDHLPVFIDFLLQ